MLITTMSSRGENLSCFTSFTQKTSFFTSLMMQTAFRYGSLLIFYDVLKYLHYYVTPDIFILILVHICAAVPSQYIH